MPIVALRGKFENWRALVAHVMEDDEIANLVIMTFSKDEEIKMAHFGMSRERMAYAALWLQRAAITED